MSHPSFYPEEAALKRWDDVVVGACTARFKGQIQLVIISIQHKLSVSLHHVKRLGVRGEENWSKDRPLMDIIFQQMIGRWLAVYMHTLCSTTEITPKPGQSSPSYTHLSFQYAQQKLMINGVECCCQVQEYQNDTSLPVTSLEYIILYSYKSRFSWVMGLVCRLELVVNTVDLQVGEILLRDCLLNKLCNKRDVGDRAIMAQTVWVQGFVLQDWRYDSIFELWWKDTRWQWKVDNFG